MFSKSRINEPGPKTGAETEQPKATEPTAKPAFDLSASTLLAGFATSFVVGIVSLGALLRILTRVGMLPFVPYLAAVGLGAVLLST